MRTLLLLRHGKAVGANPRDDHGRALNERGRRQAATIGDLLARLGLMPDVALVSDAARTQETAQLALPAHARSIVIEPRLYEATAQDIIAVVRAAVGDAKIVMVVGHNPGIGEAARFLEGAGDPQAIIGLQESFATGALAVLEFADADWGGFGDGSATLTRFIIPDEVVNA